MRISDWSSDVCSSDLPVMNGEQLAGIVDESDLIQHVALDPTRFHDPVATAMVTALKTVRPNAASAELLPVFAQGRVPIAADPHGFLGLVARIALSTYLRKQLVLGMYAEFHSRPDDNRTATRRRGGARAIENDT